MKSFAKIYVAKGGLGEAHMDVLVAVFGKDFLAPQPPHLQACGWNVRSLRQTTY